MESGVLFDQALDAHKKGYLNAALRIYQQLVKLDPEHAGGWMNLGLVQQSLGASDQAFSALKRATELAPDHGAVHYNLGNALRNRGKMREAIFAYRKALLVDPELVDAFNNLGEVLMQKNDQLTAISQFRAGLHKDPEHLGVRINLGNALYQVGKTKEALKLLKEAQKIAPNLAIIYHNLGNILRTSGQLKEAEKVLEKAIELAPEDASTRVLMGFCKLSRGQFGAGWDAYAWRWKSNAHEAARNFPAPFWKGEPLTDKRLLIWGEQAVGDELMFSAMYGDFAGVAAEVYIETEFRLQPLLQRTFPDYNVISRRDPPDNELLKKIFDYQISAGDLGRYLRRSFSDFSASRPVLKANQNRTNVLRDRYLSSAKGRRLVGISWHSKSEQAGIPRSIPLEALRTILRNPDALFVNLQYGVTTKDLKKIADFGVDIINDPEINPLKNLDEAAAQIASLDLVITVANTTAHLSGALDIPTWVILTKFPDWRWGTKGGITPWYPSVRLYRQKKQNNWRDPIKEIEAIL